MATVIPIIQHVKKNGTARVMFKITHHGQRRYINSEIYVTVEDLTKKLKVRSPQIQRVIDRERDRYMDKLLRIGYRINSMPLDDIIKHLTAIDSDYIDFIAWGRKCAENALKQGREGTAGNYITAINSLTEYIGDTTLDINDLTYTFLTKYAKWLGNRKRAISLYIGDFRTMLNLARDEYNDDEKGIFLVKVSPFPKFKIKQERSSMEGRVMSLDELQAFRATTTIKSPYSGRLVPYTNMVRTELAHDVALLSFYLIGMNAIDLYTCTIIKNNIITYNRSKTKSKRTFDKALMKVRIEPEAIELVNKYRDPTSKRVFRFYQMYKNIDGFNKAVDKGLKYFGDYSVYTFRRTWGTLARNVVRLDRHDVAEALNHVVQEMKTTDTYILRDFSIVWDANRRVLDLLSHDFVR